MKRLALTAWLALAAVTVLAPHRRARLSRREGLRDYWSAQFHHASHA